MRLTVIRKRKFIVVILGLIVCGLLVKSMNQVLSENISQEQSNEPFQVSETRNVEITIRTKFNRTNHESSYTQPQDAGSELDQGVITREQLSETQLSETQLSETQPDGSQPDETQPDETQPDETQPDGSQAGESQAGESQAGGDQSPNTSDPEIPSKLTEDFDGSVPKLAELAEVDWRRLDIAAIDRIYRYNKQAIGESLISRRNNIRAVCTSINNRIFNRPYLFHFRDIHLSWCPTYKAGSTTWKDYFVKRFVDPELEHPSLEKLWKFRLSVSGGGKSAGGKKLYQHEAAESIRFTVVRNPIVRVISYWKMSQRCEEFVRVGMHRDILLARPLEQGTSPRQREQFVQEVERYEKWCKDETMDLHTAKPVASPANPYLNPPHITFSELVTKMDTQRALLKTGDWEGHWAPASEWCDVCTHQMDYVAKLENEPWELWYIVDTVGLWDDREQFLNLKNVASSTGKPSDEQEIAKFVAMLNDNQIGFLNRFYSNDFRMFGYGTI